MAVSDAERAELAADGAIPVYGTPEEAVRALGHVSRYAQWHREGLDEPPVFAGVDGDLVAGILADALGAGGEGWLGPADVERVLAAYGIPLIESRVARSAAEAGRQAAELGGPVAIKAVAPGLVHKADAGAVTLDSAVGAPWRGPRRRWPATSPRRATRSKASSCNAWRRQGSS